MTQLSESLDAEAIAGRARDRWREAMSRATTAHVELFAKVAIRCRVSRDLDGVNTTCERAQESGMALRAFRAGYDRAGFAAASGFSADVVRWLMDTACTYRALAPASAPGSADAVPAERWDLDEAVSLPSEEALTMGLAARPHLEWIEAGTTVEVLVGVDGWLAARRRHRLWAFAGEPGARLVAQRGFEGWERLLDGPEGTATQPARPLQRAHQALVVTPEAAAPLVAALVDAFHATESPGKITCGAGWSVADEPSRPDGLAGGAFDDAGFPATSKVLAEDGLWVERLGGPGTFRRAAFREPPAEAPSNLVMSPGHGSEAQGSAAVAHRCRVLRQSPELWVLELQFAGGSDRADDGHRWLRVKPEALLAACVARVGSPRLTPDGPIVPALVFEGLAV